MSHRLAPSLALLFSALTPLAAAPSLPRLLRHLHQRENRKPRHLPLAPRCRYGPSLSRRACRPRQRPRVSRPPSQRQIPLRPRREQRPQSHAHHRPLRLRHRPNHRRAHPPQPTIPGGPGPCHLAVDATGQTLLVANYSGGSVSAISLQPDGRLGALGSVVKHTGSSVNPGRQKAPHAHGIYFAPDNRFAFAPDLGIDRVIAYRITPATAQLTLHPSSPARRPPPSRPAPSSRPAPAPATSPFIPRASSSTSSTSCSAR